MEMNIIKVETDFFFMGVHTAQDISTLFEDVPDNSQIYFISSTGKDLFVKKDNIIHETGIEEWGEFWETAWKKIGPTRNKAREKYYSELPNSYFTKVINKFSK